MKRTLAMLAVLSAAAILWALPVPRWIAESRAWLESLGAWAPATAALLYAALTMAMIPASVLSLAIAAMFGFWKGVATVVVGANLGALGAFLLFRTLFRSRAEALAARYPKYAALDAAVGRRGFRVVLLMRLSPVFPFTVMNALLGLTAVRPGAYTLANLIGMLPGTVMYVAIGSACADCLAAPAFHAGKLAVQFAGLASTVMVTVILARLARRSLDMETGSRT